MLTRVGEAPWLQGWGITVLRVVAGIIFAVAAGQNLFAADFDELGGLLLAPVVMVGSLVELLCGAALVVGLLTRWVSIVLALLMLLNILAFHLPYGFFVENEGFEYALLRLAVSATLALAGPGKVALDNVLATQREAR